MKIVFMASFAAGAKRAAGLYARCDAAGQGEIRADGWAIAQSFTLRYNRRNWLLLAMRNKTKSRLPAGITARYAPEQFNPLAQS